MLFKNYSTKTYFGVIGFVIASIVAIPLSAIIELGEIPMSASQMVISIIMIAAGTLISYKLGDK